MTTLEIAKKYVELCSAQQYDQALETLFAKNAVSVEAGGPPAPRSKHAAWKPSSKRARSG